MTGPDARAKAIFLDALELEGEQRREFCERECAGDAALLKRVEGLLGGYEEAEGVLGLEEESGDREVFSGLAASALEDLDARTGDVLGQYRLERVIGEGGFGRVYLAQQEEPVRRQVALKLIKLGMDTREVLARFDIERRSLAKMDHPHIASVLDAGATEGGRPYFVLEYVDGEQITDYVDRHGLDLAARAELFRQVCLAIQHAHSKGVLHRDIKPSNVLVAEVDGVPQPRIIDFGIAKAVGGDDGGEASLLTTDGRFVGTPAYMSPEQASSAPDVDTRSDVYALGVLLYELIAGALPFEPSKAGVSGLIDLQRRILEEPAPAPSGIAEKNDRPPCPRELDWIAQRCLEKDRDRRYPTAFALALDVARFLADEPIEAAPPSRTYWARKWLARHRGVAVASAFALLALVAGVIGTGVGFLRARDEAREANRQADIADAVNEFLTHDLLSAASPRSSGKAGPEVRMIEVLDAAAASIEDAAQPGGRFDDMPMVEAEVRKTLAQTYAWLGRYQESLDHFERAADLYRRERGPNDVDTVDCERRSCLGLLGTGRFQEGLERIDEVAVRLFANPEFGSEDVATVYQIRGSALSNLGRLEESAEALRAGLAALTEESWDKDVALNLHTALAITEIQLGNVEEADRLFELSLQRHLEVVGPESPATLVVRANRATFLRSQNRNEEARIELEETIAVQFRKLGESHPTTLITQQSLAGLLRTLGELDEALELAQIAVGGLEEQWGQAHPNTLAAYHTLAKVHEERGERERADELLQKSLRLALEEYGEDSNEVRLRRKELGDFLSRGAQ